MLPPYPVLETTERVRISDDYERFASSGMPKDVRAYLRERYRLDIAARYAGRVTKTPFGKASGQLSLNMRQVEADIEAELGFIVLKTVIAQDAGGRQAMHEWAVKATRMLVEPIAGKRVGELGFTVTWVGRGWHESFESYLSLVTSAVGLGNAHGVVVAPSCKFHLPGPRETVWRTDEYRYTVRALQGAWRKAGDDGPLILEKDFSPTLAGDERSGEKGRVLEWVRRAPELIKEAAGEEGVILGVKLMNALFDDAFQLELVKALIDREDPGKGVDFWVYANRLFDPKRAFGGKTGVAYGGPDLAARNLAVLRRVREAARWREFARPLPPLSGTGAIDSGKAAVAYALLGAESVQMHTIFQLPDVYYRLETGSKSAKAMHHLIFHPLSGLVPWMLHLRHALGIEDREGITRFLDLSRVDLELLERAGGGRWARR